MTWNTTNKLWIVMLMVFFVACSKEESFDMPEEDQYLTHIIEERHIDKTELAAQITDFIGGEGIQLPEALILGLLCDIDVAAIEYNTVGVDGSTVTASGVIAIPSGTTYYNHLLSIQHVTLDIDQAPSRQDFYYELIPVVNGHIVVMADYLGYGSSQTSDRQHPYLHARLTGTACADMIEAARQYLQQKGIKEETDSLELIGYSQGGQATIATVLELERRGKGNSIRAVHAGGGAYDLEMTLQTFISPTDAPDSYSRTGYAPYLIRGMAYGEQLDVRDENLYAPEVISNGLNELFSTRPLSEWHQALGTDITHVLHPDFFAPPSFNGNADVLAIVEALRKNSLLNASPQPQAYIHLYHSQKDEQVPYSNSVNAHAAWPATSLTDLEMPKHATCGVEFIMRYMGLWEIFGPLILAGQ